LNWKLDDRRGAGRICWGAEMLDGTVGWAEERGVVGRGGAEREGREARGTDGWVGGGGNLGAWEEGRKPADDLTNSGEGDAGPNTVAGVTGVAGLNPGALVK
jgi:hypothetical protein